MSGPESNPRDDEPVDRNEFKRWEINKFLSTLPLWESADGQRNGYMLTDFQMQILFTILGHEEYWRPR